MGRLQAIENALTSINETVFQELCDSFLILKNSNYAAFSRTGSQSGKQKTIKGTPDTFLRLPNDKYIFVECSTNVTSSLKKLKDDIKKCIDPAKTGIPVELVSEIILCINFDLKPKQDLELKNTVRPLGINLTVYTRDCLAKELNRNHRDLVHEYLGLPLDTGQIVSIDRFIKEYNRSSQSIATPLDNAFLHREDKLNELYDAIRNNDFIILTGVPGVGKTKLCIEGIRNYLSENPGYAAYCVSDKHHVLLDDLYQYIDFDKDYILFVDDANRIDAFSQIIGYYKSERKGKLKILITVRDYAFKEIEKTCLGFSPKTINLPKLSDTQISDIIKAAPFEILNIDYLKEINRIADGTPRLAIMAALLAKEKQDIGTLYDVSDLFDNYFSTFIKDDGAFADKLIVRCLGLIAFFYTIPYKNRESTTSVLEIFSIAYTDFIDAIDTLDRLELVEPQFEHVKISEQNLATYFFYKAFIKDGLLSFEVLLDLFFDSNSRRFNDCVIPANNTFGSKKVMDKLKPSIQNHFKNISHQNDKAFKFLSVFWFYLQDEALGFVYDIIERLPETHLLPKYEIVASQNEKDKPYSKNQVIKLLGELLYFPNKLKDAIELGFEYARKQPEYLQEWFNEIKDRLMFRYEDETHYFVRQIDLIEILIGGLRKKNPLIIPFFYELSKLLLAFKFQYVGPSGKKNTVSINNYSIPNIPAAHIFREMIWTAVDECFQDNTEHSFALLSGYSCINPDVVKEIMDFDIPFVVKIIEKHLSADSFEHCRYVQKQVWWCKRNSVSHPLFEGLALKFTNPAYRVFSKLDWDRLRDKASYEFEDFREYERLKEKDIRASFVFKTIGEIQVFCAVFEYLNTAEKNNRGLRKSFDMVADENCSKNFDMGVLLLAETIKRNNPTDYLPVTVFRNHLNTKEKANTIIESIKKTDFNGKWVWLLSFYENLDPSLFTKADADEIINIIKQTNNSNYSIPFDRFEFSLSIDPDFFQTVLATIVARNEHEGTRLMIWRGTFDKYFENFGKNSQLIKKAYLQQTKIDEHFDHSGNILRKILNDDTSFLLEYIKNAYSARDHKFVVSQTDLGFVWDIENIDNILADVFDFISDNELFFGFSGSCYKPFFSKMKDCANEKAKRFVLDYCKANFLIPKKMNLLADIARRTFKDVFEELLLLFLSLSQDKELFSKIFWLGNGGVYSGDVIRADIEMAGWRNILHIVDKSTVGIKLIPIKKYLNDMIGYCLKSGDMERQRNFLEQ